MNLFFPHKPVAHNLQKWYSSFLQKRNIDAPTGARLYSYHFTKQEFDDLTVELGSFRKYHGAIRRTNLTLSESICILMYAAQWWHRKYSGGAWSWDDVFVDVVPNYGDDFFYDVNERSAIIETAAYSFSNYLPDAGKRFFACIVREGGIPLNALAEDSKSNLGNFFEYLFTQLYLGFGLDTPSAKQLIKRFSALPVPLREDSFYEMASQFAVRICRIAEKVPRGLSGNSIKKALTFVDDGEEFTDSYANILIRLIKSANTIRDSIFSKRIFTASRCLQQSPLDDEVVNLVLDVEFNPTSLLANHSSDNLQKIRLECCLPKETIEEDVLLYLNAGDKVHKLFAFQPETGKIKLGTSARHLSFSGNDARSDLLVRWKGRSGKTGVGEILPIAEQLLHEAPWIFSFKDGRWFLTAQDDYGCLADSLILAVPEKSYLKVQSGEIRDVGHIAEIGRTLKEITGTVCCLIDGAEYIVSSETESEKIPSIDFLLEGQKLPVVTDIPCFIGLPTVLMRESGVSERLAPENVTWISAVQDNGKRIGYAKAVIESDGHRKRTRSCYILPERASYSVEAVERISDRDSYTGKLYLKDWRVESVTYNGDELNLSFDHESGTIELISSERPPRTFSAELVWTEASRPLLATFPFPYRECIFEKDGHPFNGPCWLTVDQLDTLKLTITDYNIATEYAVSISVDEFPIDSQKEVNVYPIQRDVFGYASIDFSSIKSEIAHFFDSHPSNEILVDVNMTIDGSKYERTHVFILAYAGRLVDEGTTIRLTKNRFLPDTEVPTINKIKAVPLSDNNQDSILIELQNNLFPIPESVMSSSGMWLFIPDGLGSETVVPAVYIPPKVKNNPLVRIFRNESSAKRIEEMEAYIDNRMTNRVNIQKWNLGHIINAILTHVPNLSFRYSVVMRAFGTSPDRLIKLLSYLTLLKGEDSTQNLATKYQVELGSSIRHVTWNGIVGAVQIVIRCLSQYRDMSEAIVSPLLKNFVHWLETYSGLDKQTVALFQLALFNQDWKESGILSKTDFKQTIDKLLKENAEIDFDDYLKNDTFSLQRFYGNQIVPSEIINEFNKFLSTIQNEFRRVYPDVGGKYIGRILFAENQLGLGALTGFLYMKDRNLEEIGLSHDLLIEFVSHDVNAYRNAFALGYKLASIDSLDRLIKGVLE